MDNSKPYFRNSTFFINEKSGCIETELVVPQKGTPKFDFVIDKTTGIEYRTPKINEFVRFFKYEAYSEGCDDNSIEDFSGWYSYSFDVGLCFRDLEDIEIGINNKTIRVRK